MSQAEFPGEEPVRRRHPHRHPFAPGAVRLPEPEFEFRPRPSVPGPGRLDSALTATMTLASLTAGATVALGGSRISGVAYATTGSWLAYLVGGVVVGRRYRGHAIVPWFAVAAVMMTLLLRTTDEPLGAASGVLVVTTAVACGAAALWELRRVRRIDAATQPAWDGGHVPHDLDRYRLAVAWNDLRQSLTVPGATVERIVDSGSARPTHRWLGIDARTGSTTFRDLGPDVEPSSWAVFDAEGHLLATAPPGAPQAWAAVVRTASRRRRRP